jgi:zinc protease
MINRTIQPTINDITHIPFVEPQIRVIGSDTTLYWMQNVLDETVRIEFHFNAGTIRSKEKIAGFVNSLLFSGTNSKTSVQINEELDSLGAFIDNEIGQETAIVSVYCLRKNVNEVTEIVVNAIHNASFPLEEVEDLTREKRQQFLVGSEKVSMLARRKFQQLLFSNSEDYSRQITLEDYDKINRESLIDFHKEYYLKGLRKVIVVSNLEESYINDLVLKVSSWNSQLKPRFENSFINKQGTFHVEKADAVQTAIRIGMPLFNKTNPDFIDFQILQTILGDYFGSRLMSNIREDKGYTYGIGTGVSESNNTGYFIIATEVGKEFVEPTIKEIQFEIDRLKNEEIPAEELSLVKNYLLGQLLKSADGPNAMLDLFMSVQLHELDFSYFERVINRINIITAQELQIIAKKYLDWDKFTIVTAGSSNK